MTIDGSIPIIHSVFPTQGPAPTPPAREGREVIPEAGPVERPAGTNAELWALLSPDEQAFFAEESVRGPLTYQAGNAEGSPAPVARGQRIDVRA